MTREGRAETREAKRTEQTNQESKSGKAAGFSSTSQKGNIVHGKLKSQKELKKITGSEDYKKSDYEGKTKMLNVATANKGMSVKQKKLAAKAPPPNKLDEKDFAVLRAEKAKGRGMGLQDEKVQPGKVMKAKRGDFMERRLKLGGVDPKKFMKTIGVFPKVSSGAGGKGSGTGGRDTRTITEKGQFIKRRNELAGVSQALKATRIGKMLLPVAAAGVAAQQYLKGKMKKDKNKKTLKDFREQKKPGIPSEKTKTINSALNKLNKKMGGGMMQKPMGYSKGGGYDSGNPGKLRDIVTKYAGKFKSRDRLTERDLETANKILKGGRGKALRSTQEMVSRLKKFDSAKKMGGGMIAPSQRPGYSKGTMVKARGCKLGRTRPTKIT